MATVSYKILGQSALSDMTETTVYTVPTATQAIVATVSVANRSGSSALVRIAVRPAADSTTASKHYILYDAEVAGTTSSFFTIGITMAAADKILAYSIGPGVSVNVFGSEIA
jgi:hypothetical protein